MRITFVAINYLPSVGGAQLLTQRVAEGLSQRHHHDVEVVTTDALRAPTSPEPGRVQQRTERISGVTVRRFPLARRTHTVLRFARRARSRALRHRQPTLTQPGPLSVGPLGLRFFAAMARACWERDVVVGVAIPYLTVVGPAHLPSNAVRAARIGIPLLHHSNENAPRRAVLRALCRLDAVVTLTAFEAEEMTRLGVESGRVHTITPGCDAPASDGPISAPEARSLLGLPERRTIGFVGRFAPYKGVDTVLAAAPRILEEHPDTTVLLAGTPLGWDEFEVFRDAASASIGDRLIVRRDFPEQEKGLLLAACDVVMTPSREESFGIVNIEAWAAARPVVAADIPAVRAVVNDGVDGLLVPVGDATGLAQAVMTLLDDPDLAAALGRAGRRRALTEFAWDAIVDQWDSLLREVSR